MQAAASKTITDESDLDAKQPDELGAKEEARADRELVLAAVMQQPGALQYASKECRRDREIVLEAVQRDGMVLRYAEEECCRDHAIALAAVQEDGRAFSFVEGECKRDPEIVLAAVQYDGHALLFAAEECKEDHNLVLAAVTQAGCALKYSAEACRRDRTIALAAVQQDRLALDFVAEELLLDSTFAAEAKGRCFMLKVSLLSGRYTYQVTTVEFGASVDIVLSWCCEDLGIDRTGMEALVLDDYVVPDYLSVEDWPGIRPPGEISEYMLVVGAKAVTKTLQ